MYVRLLEESDDVVPTADAPVEPAPMPTLEMTAVTKAWPRPEDPALPPELMHPATTRLPQHVVLRVAWPAAGVDPAQSTLARFGGVEVRNSPGSRASACRPRNGCSTSLTSSHLLEARVRTFSARAPRGAESELARAIYPTPRSRS